MFGTSLVIGAVAASPSAAQAADSYNCVARPRAVVELGSSDQGIITALKVDRGDVVEEGMVVAQLDSELQALNADLARLRAESDVEIRSAEARIVFRAAEMQRARTLFDREVVSTTALEEAEIEGHLADLALETSRLQQQIAEVEFAQARVLHDRRSVQSPVAGVVVELMAAAGEYYYEQRHLMRIAQIDPLHVETYLPVSEYGEIKVGSLALVTMDEPIGGTYTATVTVVDRVFDPESRTFGVRLELPNSDFALPAGMICTVRFLYEDTAEIDEAEIDSEIDMDLETGQ
ncbi:efflux RND transporter periplasmic adaptor subunit [Pararhodobacter sp. SW119]|uniref:efflux RND transporter periplasmic adaptor subunit n=1 Tax=Pararhodobacter sp. SW119 TaxID=2780075 RepID=UPI001ADF73AB|nr:efflux RND transporter periplasmic adaptor subunit [Pararhodobacter sp. SW119]